MVWVVGGRCGAYNGAMGMTLRRRTVLLLRLGIGVVLGLALLWWLFRDVDGQRLLAHMRDFSWAVLVPAVGLVVLSGVVRAHRWQLLFPDDPPSASRLFFVENTGIGVNSIAPVRVLAEPIQFGYLVFQDGRERGAVLASIVLVRVVDLAVTLGMVALGFLAFPPAPWARAQVWLAVEALAAVALVVTVLSIFAPGWSWMSRWPLLVTYGAAWRQLLARPRRLARVLVVTAVQWLLLGLAAWIIARGMGLELSLPVVHILALAIMTLGLMLPGLPSGVGPFEFAATLLLSFYGVEREPALAFGIILHGAFLLPPILVAAFTLIVFGPPWRAAPRRRARATTRTPVAPRSGGGAGPR